MAAERVLLLPEEEQLRLTINFYDDGLFGIKEDPREFFPLKSTPRRSPHYFDVRPGISSYRTRQLLAATMENVATSHANTQGFDTLEETYDHLAGTPEAMTTYATTLADRTRMSLLQPRVATQKASGNKTPILGRFNPEDRVAAFDDTVTEGQSIINTVLAFEAAHLMVIDYFVVVNREEGGAKQVLQHTGLAIIPALSLSGMVKMLRAVSRINTTQLDNVTEYLEQYGEPHAQEAMRAVR